MLEASFEISMNVGKIVNVNSAMNYMFVKLCLTLFQSILLQGFNNSEDATVALFIVFDDPFVND